MRPIKEIAICVVCWSFLMLYLAAWLPFILLDSIYQEVTGKPSFLGASPSVEVKGYSPERKN